jgi:hypothetical protein
MRVDADRYDFLRCFRFIGVEGVVAGRKADAGSGTGGWFRTAQGRWADCASLGTLILVAGRQAGGHMGTAPAFHRGGILLWFMLLLYRFPARCARPELHTGSPGFVGEMALAIGFCIRIHDGYRRLASFHSRGNRLWRSIGC